MKTLLTTILLLICIKATNAQAPSYLYAHSIGSTDFDQVNAITHDNAGNTIFAGAFRGTVDFNPSPSDTFNLTSSLYDDIFICKLDSAGNFVWAKGIGDVEDDEITSVAVDQYGNIYATGYFFATIDFNPDSAGVFNLTPTGLGSAFILKLDAGGNFVWAASIGSTGLVSGSSIQCSSDDYIIMSGLFQGTADFDVTAGLHNMTADSGTSNGFILKMDLAGFFIWSGAFNGTFSNVKSVALDASGGMYATGYFSGTVDFDPSPGVFNMTVDTNMHSFIVAIDSLGNFIHAGSIGGNGEIWCDAINIDNASDIICSGYFTGSPDFDPDSVSSSVVTSNGGADAFVVKLNNAGDFQWAFGFGGSGGDHSMTVTSGSSGDVYLAGDFENSADFNPGAGTINLSSAGGSDAFLVKLTSSGSFSWATSIGGSGDENVNSVVYNNGNVFMGGSYRSPAISFGAFNLTNAGSNTTDMFITKMNSCKAQFTIFPDTVPHNWFALDQSSGVQPLTYLWNWGDSTTSTGANPVHTYSTPAYYNICLDITDAAGCVSNYCDSSTYIVRGNSSSSIITVTVVAQLTLSTPAIDDALAVSVFPNPSSDRLMVAVPAKEKFDAALFDLNGKEVNRFADQSESFSIDVSELANGIYFLKVVSGKDGRTFRIVVSR